MGITSHFSTAASRENEKHITFHGNGSFDRDALLRCLLSCGAEETSPLSLVERVDRITATTDCGNGITTTTDGRNAATDRSSPAAVSTAARRLRRRLQV